MENWWRAGPAVRRWRQGFLRRTERSSPLMGAMSMPDPALNETLPDSLLERCAVKAWSRLRPNSVEPTGLEVLKRTAKSAVYRLEGVGPDGATVIAKRCHAKTAAFEWMIYQEFLPRLPMPALCTYGFLPEPDGESCWL